MKRSLCGLSAVIGCAALMTGCIEHHATVHKDVERVKVQFENESAGRIFYEKLSRMPSREQKESKTQFCIPIVFDYERKVITDDSAKFNYAVNECDSNHDGVITETEAKIFAARP